jgi:amino acid adenylation domain-containing protein
MSDTGFTKTLTPKKRELLELLLQEKKQKASTGQWKTTPAAIPKRAVFSPAPVSFAQQRLWFIDQLTPGIPAFNIPAAVQLKGALNVELLHKAFAEIIRRHETLRTSFTSHQGSPVQVIAPSVNLEIPVVDLRAMPQPARTKEVQRLVTQDCQHSFDLTQPPLFRVTLVMLDENDQVLILMMHHIIGDVWSVRLLMKELAKLYEALSTAQSFSLPELPIQYADYAVWQRDWLQGPTLLAELGYWKEQLEGMTEELELPLDHPRPPVQSIWGAKHFLKVPKAVDAGVRALGRKHGASLFMTLLAGWKALLHRYTGQEDIVVGAPVANRNRSEYENMIGFFVNSVLLRTDISGDPTFLELLARVREMVFGAFSHQDFPFERLVEVLQPVRNMSRNPLYQTDVILQNAPTAAYKVTGMSFEPLPVETGTAQLDMTLDLWEEADGLGGWLEYDTDLFDRSTISRMVNHYVRLLEKVVENPALRISEIPLLTEAEERQLLVEWNDTAREYDLGVVYSQLFEKQAGERAQEIAVICGSERLSYEQLNDRANHLAHLFLQEGVGPETVVALLAARSVDLLVGMLAVFKAGGAYIPLDPLHPAQRHLQVLEQSRAPVVVSAKAFLPALQEAIDGLPQAPKVIVLEELPASQHPMQNPPVRCTPADLAYVLFTSGSTGVPKGVMIHHRGMINHLLANIEKLGMTHADVMAQTASQCFDISVWQFLTPLILGGCVHIFDDEITKDPPRLLREVDRHAITVFETVPSLLQVALAETRGAGSPKLNALRWLLPTGEAVSAQLCREWFHEYPDVPLMNAYGPSECSDDVTLYAMEQPPDEASLRVSIGTPVANLQVSVLDKNLRHVPIGVGGELCVRGVGVGRGYLSQPDRTAVVFVPDPFSREPGARMYRSGDRARYRADGHLEFLGRMDHQVKVRGFRIELGEIEAVLGHHQGVQDAVVIVREDTPGDRRLVGYVILRKGVQCNPKELQEHLKQKLPDYMVPAAFVVLERLPVTPNGKVDRKTLPIPEMDTETQDFVAARKPVEEVLAGMWADILGVEKVSVEGNLFEMGAHSLLVTQVVSRIRKAFSVEPPLRTFFESPTVAGMARVIEKLRGEAEGGAAPPIVRTPRDGNYPLSFTQERMWFLDQMEQDLTAYNVPGAVYMDGALNVAALEAGFTEILRRHEIFRTTYKTVEGKPVQVIQPARPFDLPVVDLSALRSEHREEEALRIARENAQRPFDLRNGPVLRVFLMRSGTRQHLLAMTTHHIAYDMWAREIFIYELGLLYEQYVKGLPSPLEEPEIQWVDYASWLRKWMQGEVLEQQLSYWRKKLAGAPPFIDLPIDLPRPPVQSYKGARQYLELPTDVVRGLKALSRKYGVTQFITVLAAFKTLLYRWTGQEHIVLGTPIANRNRIDVEKLMGFLANILVFNTDLGGDPTFVELLERVRETALGAYAHQDLPFEFLVQDLQPERSLSRPAIFQISFNYMLNYSAPTVNLTDLSLRLERLHSGASHFEISVDMWETEDGVNGVIEYCTDLFHHSTITQLVTRFRRLLEGVATNANQHISDLPLLSQSDRDEILLQWNDTRTAYPRERSVPQLFEQQTELTPNAIALEFRDSVFTYREVDQKATQIAHYLRDLGVGQEMPVGVCLGRSPELIFVLLGILKAGGAYLPLDASYPAERLSFMLEDTHCQVLITDRPLLDPLPVSAMITICIDEEWSVIAEKPCERLPVLPQPENLAYIIYTSGSTGAPKGVAVVHHNIIRLVRETSYASIGRDEVFLLLAPVSFDASTLEIWAPLLNGARLAICPEPNPSLPELGAVLKKHQVTTLWLTAGLFRLMVDEQLESLASLLQLIAGGDVLSVPHVRRVIENLSCRMINGYGPTENTTFSCCHTVRGADDLTSTVPIGRPIANTQAYVLDTRMQPVPAGTVGELYLGGEGLARGYVGRPELTAEKFVPHPHSLEPGARLYRTGDWARYSCTGELEFIGRKDGQVKIRGFRIELAEIEAHMAKNPAVQDVVVLASQKSGSHEKRIVAYVVPKDSAPVSISDLREYAQQRMPEYMMPSGWMILEALPLTANGKVDRDALNRYDDLNPAEGEIYITPRTAAEQTLAQIWQELLEVERVSCESGFFDLGGHSLLAMQAISRINKTFSIDLPTRMFFEFPTVAGLARAIEELKFKSEAAEAIPITRVPRDGNYPLSFTQQRMWFLDRFEPGLTAYNIPAVVMLEGGPNQVALEAAFTEIVRRHEVLRTTYSSGGDEAVQVIHPPEPVALQIVDLRGLDAAARDGEALRLARESSQRPFDLSRGLVFRAMLVRCDERRYLLAMTFHHIAYDMWAARVFMTELAALYEEFAQGRPSSLKELEIQWADYATWQRNWLQGEVLEKQFNYWRKKLADAPRFLDLPVDLPRPATQSYNGACESFQFGLELAEQIRAFGRSHNVTPFITVLAAFKVLLHRWTGQQHIVIGSPIANRNRIESEQLIGFLANTLVFNTDLSGDPTVLELLGRVREIALEAYAHQDMPFEFLVQDLQPERVLSRPPIFQVSLNHQSNPPLSELKLSDITLRPASVHNGTVQFEISADFWENEEGLCGVMEYCTDLFHQSTIRRAITHFRRLLEGVVANPSQHISELPLLSDVERQQMVFEWNNTGRVYRAEQGFIHQQIEQQAALHPDKPAVVFEEQQLTYGELERQANQLAWKLRSLGAGRGVLVGICAERSLEMVVGLLGILKSGAAYVPLDPGYPKDRLAYMMADAEAPVLLTQQHLYEQLRNQHACVLCLDSEWQKEISEQPCTAPGVEFCDADLAYVIYTSGSTGQPKGAMNTHGGIRNRLLWMQEMYSLTAQDKVLQKTPFSFDVSVWEFFWPLMTGAQLVVARPGGHQDSSYLVRLIEEKRVTTVHFVPSMLQLFLEDPGVRRCASLKRVICSGEALPLELKDRFFTSLGCELHNLYGPTEASVDVTFWQCHPDDGLRTVPIGRPIANTQMYVLDQRMEPVPAGVPGALYIGGAGLARGYWKRASLTAEKFVPNPFSEAGARLYQTGDVGRYLADGSIEYLGRADYQVKIRGFRIELGEIETALQQINGVKEAVVVAREERSGDKRLAAYVVLQDPQALAIQQLRDSLKDRLPAYMVPSAFVVMEKMPLSPNGKIDRKSLPAPEFAAESTVIIAPRTATEETVAEIWAQVLSISNPGVHSNFFELGGHSLLAMRLMTRINDGFKANLSLRVLFEAPTIAGLAERIETALMAGEEEPQAIELAPRGVPLPLSFSQENLWLFEQLSSGTSTYTTCRSGRVQGPLNVAALQDTLNEIFRRHEALHTSFETRDNRPVQIVHPHRPCALPAMDLSGLAPADREREALRISNEYAQRPIDLGRAPVANFGLLRLGAEEHVFILSVHHAAYDLWSGGILLGEIERAYRAFAAGVPFTQPEPAIQYADFAVWQRKWLQGEMLDRQLAYWKEKLAGLSALPMEIPTDRPRPAVENFPGASVYQDFSKDLTEKLKELGRREGVTQFMLLLAVFKVLLHRYTRQDDVVVGSVIANRNRPEMENTVGFFDNVMVLRSDASGNPTFRDYLRRVRDVALGAYAHQHLPFEYLVKELKPDRIANRTPWIQAMFVYLLNYPAMEREMAGLKVVPYKVHSGKAMFDLLFAVRDSEQGLKGELVYNCELFDESTIERMVSHFHMLLVGIVEDPQKQVSELRLLSTEEERWLLLDWNNTSCDYSCSDGFIHQQIERQAELRPRAMAVVFEGEKLTYAELNQKANQLARKLESIGAGRGSLIAVCMERSLEMVISLVATLKAGAAYVPLDPGYPGERLAYMIEDAQAPVLLVQRDLLDRLPEVGACVVAVDADWSNEIEPYASSNLNVPLAGEDLAYVIYTSGSTGKPKAAMNTHMGIRNRLLWGQETYRLTPEDKVMQKTPFSFDVSVWEFFWPLISGAQLVVAKPGGHRDGSYLVELIQQQGITTVHFVPSMLNMFLEETGLESCSSLKRVMCSGEALSLDLKERFFTRMDCELHNLYGPTEASVEVTYWECRKDDGIQSVPIGRPISNTRMYVLDREMCPVPMGVPGDLYIGGIGVARGYWRRAALTAEKFVPDPFSADKGSRLYHTGDIARYRNDGSIEYMGRTDYQVKIRGFRIELGEIEAVLLRQSEIKEAVVVAREERTGDKKLVAYLIPAKGMASGEGVIEKLKAGLKKELPHYMAPSAFVLLEKMPLLPNGKVDRKSLPAPEFDLLPHGAYVPPRDTLELQLVQIWEELLGVQPIGVRDNFFEVGGHSLRAVQLTARIRQQFGKSIPIAVLLQSATIEALAGALRRQTAKVERQQALIRMKAGGDRKPFFCVHPVGGNVLCYAGLARHLSAEQPFYALQSSSEDSASIQAMASHYLAEARSVQAQGPYLLGGWSMGGVVAFEMARQLQLAGEQAEVFLIDSLAPGLKPVEQTLDERTLLDYFVQDMEGISGKKLGLSGKKFQELEIADAASSILEQLRKQGITADEIEQQDLLALFHTFRDNLKALLGYSPMPIAGSLILIRSSSTGREQNDSFLGWSDLALGRFEMHEIEGNHYSIVTGADVNLLAALLEEKFAERRESAIAGG